MWNFLIIRGFFAAEQSFGELGKFVRQERCSHDGWYRHYWHYYIDFTIYYIFIVYNNIIYIAQYIYLYPYQVRGSVQLDPPFVFWCVRFIVSLFCGKISGDKDRDIWAGPWTVGGVRNPRPSRVWIVNISSLSAGLCLGHNDSMNQPAQRHYFQLNTAINFLQ